LTVLPSRNLISNIGFDSAATNTKGGSERMDRASERLNTYPSRDIVRDAFMRRIATFSRFHRDKRQSERLKISCGDL
jgi:hypothetical protein